MNGKGLKALVAMGLVGTVTTVAQADPAVINITGGTLPANFIKSPASTRDFIDSNGNSITTIGTPPNVSREQLAPDISIPVTGVPASTFWIVHYRAVGSVNGLKELLRNGRTYYTGAAADSTGFPYGAVGTDGAYFNRTLFALSTGASGAGASAFNASNPGGFPWRSTTPASGSAPQAVFPGGPGDGLRADITPLDVPTKWAVTVSGAPSATRKPGENGYGNNPLPTRRIDGVMTAYGDATTTPGAYWSRLADLGTANLYDGVPANANANTIFDIREAHAPIVPMANVATGVQQAKMSELRHLFTTGRMPDGQNLVAITRDSGSGTRNGWMNSLQTDPSFGVGENIGVESNNPNDQITGALYTPSNKAGTGGLRTTIRNTRLGVGYLGGDSAPPAMGANNQAEIIAVMNDLIGGTVYVRPTAANVISNNTSDTWRIAGPGTLATFGDPDAEPVSAGGLGRSTPRMRNPAAAAWVNNVNRSIENFSLPNNQGSLQNYFSPGEAAATFFILPNGVEYVQDTLDNDHDGNVTEWIPNPSLIPSLRDWELANSVYSTAANAPLFANFDTTKTGKHPTRLVASGVYSDAAAGVSDGGNYKNQAGVNRSFSQDIDARNKIVGDFDFDGLRNVNDVPGMIAAWRDRQGLGAWDGVGTNGGASDTSAIIEVLGDFNSDGTFDSKDVRYFADGLAMTTTGTPHLDRKAGFTAVDNASSAQGGSPNFFGIAPKSTGHPYAAGDARGDVASARVSTDTLGNPVAPYFKGTPGFAPTGGDGVVDGWDITYIYKQFKSRSNVPSEIVHWSSFTEAQGSDLSCDMNGDMNIDILDVQEVVTTILGTTMGDVNLNGVQDQADAGVITANLGMTNAAWQDGDLDGDGVVTSQDMSVYLGLTKCGKADVGQQGGLPGYDGQLDNNDFIAFISYFFAQNPIADQGQQGGLPGSDGQWDNNDFIAFIANFFGGCN